MMNFYLSISDSIFIETRKNYFKNNLSQFKVFDVE